MHLRFLLAPLCAAALLALDGCASSNRAPHAPAPEPAPARSLAAPESPPEPSKAGMRADFDHERLKAAIKGAQNTRLRTALVGKTVYLSLERVRGSGDVQQYVVDLDDRIAFRCRKSLPSFVKGEVVARIQAARFDPKTKRTMIDLDECAAPEKQAAEAALKTPSASLSAPPSSGAPKSGMDAAGNVIDSSKVESGSGRLVKGLNDYEGEITGRPARGSKFAGLQIGMSVSQVTGIVGPATDQGAYMTGKAWIPFYFGADRHRFEMTYKGQGRLIFAGGGLGDFSNGHLIWIIHNANEPGYR